MTVDADGVFTFATRLADGAAYAVTVLTQPSGAFCSVTSGSGTVGSADVTDVAVTCGASGTLDTTFNGTGFVVLNNLAGGNGADGGGEVVVDASGRILVTAIVL